MSKITIIVEDDSDAWKAHRLLEETRERERGQEKTQQQEQEQEEKRLSTAEILELLNDVEEILDNADAQYEHLTKDKTSRILF